MSKLKQSICYWCFGKHAEIGDLIDAAVELGFASIEMAPEEHWAAIKDAGLDMAIIGGHDSITVGLNRREEHDRIEREINENIEKAVKHGIPSLIVFSGNRDGMDDQTGIEICAEGIRRVIKTAEDAGITLCMELLNSKVNHPDYQCDTTPWGVELCRAVDSPNFKLLYDIYHMQIMEGDLIRTIREYAPYIGHIHTAGNPGRNDLDTEQEIYYPPVMRALVEVGYEGYVGHEFMPKGDWKEALRHAYDVCDV